MERFLRILLIFLALTLVFTGCKDESSSKSVQDEVDDILDPDIQDALEDSGMTLYTGENPPDLTAPFSGGRSIDRAAEDGMIYNADDLDCVFDSQDLLYLQNLNYYFRLYDQDGTNITVDYTNGYGDEGIGVGAYILGEDNKFTIYSEVKGEATDYGISINYKTVSVYSGELTAEGIINFEMGFVMTDKDGDDNDEYMMPVDEFRIYEEGDGLLENTDYFPSSGGVEAGAGTDNLSRSSSLSDR